MEIETNPLTTLEPNPKRPKMSSTTSDDDETRTTAAASDGVERKPRYKRRKIAIFFAYCGVGYQGMQKNPGAKTIEGELEEALFNAGAVPEQDRGCPKRYDWARSARTDKGVSAVGQVVTGRFYVDPPGFIERLNSHLPDQFRVFGFKRATAAFNSKKFCDRRRYMYLLPVFALDPCSHPDRESVLASLGSGNELVKCFECSERGRKVEGLIGKRCFYADQSTFVGCNSSENDDDKLDEQHKLSSENEVSVQNDGISKLQPEPLEVLNVGNLEVVESIDKHKVVSDNDASVHNVATTEELNGGMAENGDNLKVVESIDEHKVVSDNDVSMHNVATTEELNGMAENGDNLKVVESIDEHKTVSDNEISMQNVATTELKSEGEANGEGKDMKRSEFCYGEAEKERFNRILKCYEGTHNFHNFTTRTKAEDPSAQRFIISFHANTTVVVDGMEFIKCEVVGQSFMLHQIRKMIGVAVAIMRNCAPESLIETALQKGINITVPTAPEVGLYLDECFFTSYNNKWKDTHEELSMKDYTEEAEAFKMKYIYSHIASTEQKEGSIGLWLHSLNHRNYPDLRMADTAVASSVEETIEAADNVVVSTVEANAEKIDA